LAAKNDTVIKYNKAFKSFEKDHFKQEKTADKDAFKQDQARDKISSKNVKTLIKNHTKTIENLEKNNGYIEKYLEYVGKNKAKIKSTYPKAVDYEKYTNLNKGNVQHWEDSIAVYTKIIVEKGKEIKRLRENTTFNPFLSDQNYVNYLLKKNAEFIPFNSYSTSEITQEIDSLIAANASRL
jgi:hypothetical protein